MQNIIRMIEQEKLIVIARGIAKEKLLPLTEALYAGGVRLLELPFSADQSIPDEEIAARIEMLCKHFDGKMLFGTGTVLNLHQVELTKSCGGCFVISPNTRKEVIEHTKKLGMISIPGALTPTEVEAAHAFGADFVKLFPISDMGVGYVKALRAPLSHIKLLAVGGVNLENLKDYIKAGACGIGIGSILDRELINAGKFDEIEKFAASYTAALKELS